MKLSDMKQMISYLRSTSICEFELSQPGFSLRIKMNPSPVAEVRGGAETQSSGDRLQGGRSSLNTQSIFLKAPVAGRFLASHPSRPGRLAQPGQEVRHGGTVGLIQVGPLYRAVSPTQRGTIIRTLVESGQTVEYGQSLFEFSPR
jgi:biotin carboxyl carrier protein